MYEEIKELFAYCQEIGVKAELRDFLGGYALIFPNGCDFVQHPHSYGADSGCVEPAIGCKLDYSAVPLKNAKRLVKRYKKKLNKEAADGQQG